MEPSSSAYETWGRPREVVNALLYLLRTGCPSEFPKRSAVRYYFDKWRADGTLEEVNTFLRGQARQAARPVLH